MYWNYDCELLQFETNTLTDFIGPKWLYIKILWGMLHIMIAQNQTIILKENLAKSLAKHLTFDCLTWFWKIQCSMQSVFTPRPPLALPKHRCLTVHIKCALERVNLIAVMFAPLSHKSHYSNQFSLRCKKDNWNKILGKMHFQWNDSAKNDLVRKIKIRTMFQFFWGF